MHIFVLRKHLYRYPVRGFDESGFTLVEALVAGIVSTVVLGIMISIFTMNSNGVKDGAVNAKVQSQYEIAIAEIGASVRSASYVLDGAAGETPPASAADFFSADTTSSITMYYRNINGNVTWTRGFRVENGVLMEWKPGWAGYQPFIVGSWGTLSVPDARPFQLSASRKTLTVSMSVTGTLLGATALVPARGEVFTCRN